MKNKKFRFYGLILYYFLKFISMTVKIEIIKSKNFSTSDGYICGFWHNKLVGASIALKGLFEKKACLASPSKDGELISVPLEKMGFTMVRGSSGRDSIKSVLQLVKLVQEGYCAGTPVDGPKGPIYQVKPGMLYLAQKSGNAFLPVGIACSNKWVFEKAWDQFQLPKPFSKIICIIGEPIFIPENSDRDEYLDLIRDELLELDKLAESKLK